MRNVLEDRGPISYARLLPVNLAKIFFVTCPSFLAAARTVSSIRRSGVLAVFVNRQLRVPFPAQQSSGPPAAPIQIGQFVNWTSSLDRCETTAIDTRGCRIPSPFIGRIAPTTGRHPRAPPDRGIPSFLVPHGISLHELMRVRVRRGKGGGGGEVPRFKGEGKGWLDTPPRTPAPP